MHAVADDVDDLAGALAQLHGLVGDPRREVGDVRARLGKRGIPQRVESPLRDERNVLVAHVGERAVVSEDHHAEQLAVT